MPHACATVSAYVCLMRWRSPVIEIRTKTGALLGEALRYSPVVCHPMKRTNSMNS